MNHLPEVKTFLHQQVVPGKWSNVEVEWIGGAAPTAKFLNAAGDEVERTSLEPLNQAQIAELLVSKGFFVKDEEKDEL